MQILIQFRHLIDHGKVPARNIKEAQKLLSGLARDKVASSVIQFYDWITLTLEYYTLADSNFKKEVEV